MPCPPSRPRRGLSSLIVLSGLCSIAVTTCSAYEFIGRVSFSNEARGSNVASPLLPRLTTSTTSTSSSSSSSSRTLLVTRSGDAYLSTPSALSRRGLLQDIQNISEDALELAKAAIRTASLPVKASSTPFSSERTQVSDTELFPFSAVGMLVGGAPATAPSGTPGIACSGALISRRHVLTAAHCVFDLKSTLTSSTSTSKHSFVSSLDFYPARTGMKTPLGSSTIRPIIPWKSVRVMEAFVAQDSYNTAAMNLDFALITLERDADASAGWLALQDPSASSSPSSAAGDPESALLVTTAGYPTGLSPNYSMWTSSCAPGSSSQQQPFFNLQGTDAAFAQIDECAPAPASAPSASACSNIGAHTCKSTHGQSGSPMWSGRASGKVVAILTGSVTSTTSTASAAAAAAPASVSKNDTLASSSLSVAAPAASSDDPALLPPTPVATKINPFVYSTLLGWASEEDPGAGGGLESEPSGQMPRRRPPPRVVDLFGLRLDLGRPRDVAWLSCIAIAGFGLLFGFFFFCVARPGVRAWGRARARRAEMDEWENKRGGGGGGGGGAAGVSGSAVVAVSASSAV